MRWTYIVLGLDFLECEAEYDTRLKGSVNIIYCWYFALCLLLYTCTDISFALFFLAVYVSNLNFKLSGAWSINALPSAYICERCGKIYKRKSSLRNHVRDECGREPRFHCYICPYRTHQKGNLLRHLTVCHKGQVPM